MDDTHLIRSYCNKIRRSLTKEELEESRKRRLETKSDTELVDEAIKEHSFLREKPTKMSDEEWTKRKREIRRRKIQENKEAKTDWAIVSHSPWWIVHDKVNWIMCECEAEQLRRGIYCKTCRLMKKVDRYMMELFKDAAEGRSSSS